jgi:hypothetical protein
MLEDHSGDGRINFETRNVSWSLNPCLQRRGINTEQNQFNALYTCKQKHEASICVLVPSLIK